MKNPHGVEPTRFMKRKESGYAIECNLNRGPIFYGKCYDLFISDNCNCNNRSYTYNDGRGYDCHPVYKNSLFVNTNDSDKQNHFIVSDYDVFAYN